MNHKGGELADAIVREVASWPGASVEIVTTGKHPKAKLTVGDKSLFSPFSSTPGGSSFKGTLGTIRRTLRQLGAEREKPESDADDEEAAKPYRPAPPKPVRPAPGPEPVQRRDPMEPLATLSRAESVSTNNCQELPEKAEADAAEVLAAAEAIQDGVYFGLPDRVYRAVRRLSTSGIKQLCVSPGTFWAGSWLDPNAPPPDEDATAAMILGRAYHCARLEPELFELQYCRALDIDDFGPKVLRNGTEIGEALAGLGEAKKRAGESVVEQAERLEAHGWDGPIWPLEKARWDAARGDKTPIGAKFWDALVVDMERLRTNPEIADLFGPGGASEVSIFWTDRHGIEMKARVDRLEPAHWLDFKTYDNSRGLRLDSAIFSAMRYQRYHVQAVVYRDAVEALRTGGLDIVGDASPVQRELVAGIRLRPAELACHFVFQEKGGVPNLTAWEFEFFDVPGSIEAQHAGATEAQIAAVERATRRPTGLHNRGVLDVEGAKRDFLLYGQVYPPGVPWAPINARRVFDDIDFQPAWLEGRIP